MLAGEYDRRSDPDAKVIPSLIKYTKRQNWSQNEETDSLFENTELVCKIDKVDDVIQT